MTDHLRCRCGWSHTGGGKNLPLHCPACGQQLRSFTSGSTVATGAKPLSNGSAHAGAVKPVTSSVNSTTKRDASAGCGDATVKPQRDAELALLGIEVTLIKMGSISKANQMVSAGKKAAVYQALASEEEETSTRAAVKLRAAVTAPGALAAYAEAYAEQANMDDTQKKLLRDLSVSSADQIVESLLKDKDRLTALHEEYDSAAAGSKEAIARLLQRQWALETISGTRGEHDASLLQFVNRFGVLFPVLSVVMGVCFLAFVLSLVSFPLGAVIAAAGIGTTWWVSRRWLAPIAKALRDYPLVCPPPEKAIRSRTAIVWLYAVLSFVMSLLLLFLMVYLFVK